MREILMASKRRSVLYGLSIHHKLHILISKLNKNLFYILEHLIKPYLNYTRFQVDIYENLIFNKQQSIFLLRLFDQIEKFQHPPDGARSKPFFDFLKVLGGIDTSLIL